MLQVSYRKTIPYPIDVVLGQYWDYEHIEHVHPDTLGRYELVEAIGDTAIYDQIWPPGLLGRLFDGLFGRARSRVRHTQLGPYEMEFVFLDGRHKGVRVHTLLSPEGDGTRIDETYFVRLPDWGWLRRIVERETMKEVEEIWDEDLDVEVCHGGWPGLPPFEGEGVKPAETGS